MDEDEGTNGFGLVLEDLLLGGVGIGVLQCAERGATGGD